MSERPARKFSFAALTNYNGPIEGGDLFPFVGYATGIVESGTRATGPAPNHNDLIMWRVRADDEGCQGLVTLKSTVFAGVDKNGDDLSKQTADVLYCSGAIDIDGIKAHAGAQTEAEPEQIIAMVAGKRIWFEMGRYEKDGVQKSAIENFCTQETYAKMKATPGAFRRDPPAQARSVGGRAQGPVAPIGAMPAGVPNLGGARPAALAAPPAPRAMVGVPVVPGAPPFAGAVGNSSGSPTLALGNSLPPPPRS